MIRPSALRPVARMERVRIYFRTRSQASERGSLASSQTSFGPGPILQLNKARKRRLPLSGSFPITTATSRVNPCLPMLPKPSELGQGKRDYHQAFLCDHSSPQLVPDISDSYSALDSPGNSENSEPDHWDITLDRDLYETIIKWYPEWFSTHFMAESGDMLHSPGSPRSVVDEASLQKAMERNKESLKVKLLLRRPISQLVDQGIMPPLKLSPGFYEQSKKLERARMGDFLKHKIQRRPERQALIEQHILEDTTISPGLQDKQRQLKKVRLADDLNDRLSHRPGPLELIKGNILVADERLAQAIKEGAIHFKATSEGEPVKHPPPLFHLEDPETSSDGTRSPPQDPSPPIAGPSFPLLSSTETITKPSFSGTPVVPPQDVNTIPLIAPTNSPLLQTPLRLGSICTVSTTQPGAPQPGFVSLTPFSNTSPNQIVVGHQSAINRLKPAFTPGTSTAAKNETSKYRKKSKSKVQPKTRTIKFHEYKGPPNAQKNNDSSTASSIESSYELMLKQQQLLLQLELEWQQKMASGVILATPQKQNDMMEQIQSQTILMPNQKQQPVQVVSNDAPATSIVTLETPLQKTTVCVPPSVSTSCKIISKLEDLKVNDLKAHLKKRNMTVSGSKPQLIERLKPFADEVIASSRNMRMKDEPASPNSSTGSPMSDQQKMSLPVSPDAAMDVEDKSRRSSDTPMEINDNVMNENQTPQFVPSYGEVPTLTATPFNNGFIINEDILKLQQKRIEQLQRELESSQQQQLQQQQQFHFQLQHPFSFHPQAQTISIPLASIATPQFQVISSPSTNGLVIRAAEPAPNQQPSRKPNPQENPVTNQNLKPQRRHSHAVQTNKDPPQTTNQRKTSASVKASLAAFLHNQAAAHQATLASTSQPQSPELEMKQTRTNSLSYSNSNTAMNGLANRTSSLPNFAEPKKPVKTRPPPPNYEEATRESCKQSSRKKSVKSQAVDDVLEILIKNGELPPSAAQEPQTPIEKPAPMTFNVSKPGQNSEEKSTIVSKEVPCTNDMNLDLDFALDLQELAGSMDFNSVNHNQDKNCGLWTSDLNNESSKKSHTMNNEVTLSELMEVANGVDWLSDLNVANLNNNLVNNNRSQEVPCGPDSYLNNMRFHEERPNFSTMCFGHDKSMTNHQSICSSSSSSCSSSYAAKDHDPVLPNNMLGTATTTDPLIDLFFDESDFKTSHDLNVWERLDFAT